MNLKSLLGNTVGGVSVPTYAQGENKDSIDLHIKSLLYQFKRLRINKLSTFLNEDHTLKYVDVKETNQELLVYYEKLDQTYQTPAFLATMINDEYRVMVDYFKNKFRSFCIVSEYPSPNMSRPGSPVKGIDSKSVSDPFPPFVDYKERPARGFRFVLLPLQNLSPDFIADTLASSDIYCEHFASFEYRKRYQYAAEAVRETVPNSISTRNFDITESQKAAIIRRYLTKLAFNVQLSRIHDSYLKQREPTTSPVRIKPSINKLNSSDVLSYQPKLKPKPSINHLNMAELSLSSSPPKQPIPPKLSPKKSTATIRPSRPSSPVKNSRPSSPTKSLAHKPSVSKLKLDELYNPVTSPPLHLDPTEMKSETSHTSTETSDSSELYQKCYNAVKDKLERERRKLAG